MYAGPAERTMSASSTMARPRGERATCSRPGHQVIDRRERGVAKLAREVRVDRGRARAFVPELLLDELEGDPGFQEMRGVAMAERVDMGTLVDAALLHGSPEGALETGT